MKTIALFFTAASALALASSMAEAHYRYRATGCQWVQTGPYYGQGYWGRCGHYYHYPKAYYNPYYYPYYPHYHYDPYYRPGIYLHFNFSPRRHYRHW